MSELPFLAVMVANRGEIAAQVLRTVKALGLRAFLMAHRVDAASPAAALADDVISIDVEGRSPLFSILPRSSQPRAQWGRTRCIRARVSGRRTPNSLGCCRCQHCVRPPKPGFDRIDGGRGSRQAFRRGARIPGCSFGDRG
ncbi:MAG: biotin carboxylase N-terminal domain-containing protein [Sphingorhabdus sp.]|uniref:biotin carboxylase N-terminal domain-containing protein n=1 Tax=Sphingorhabdus sp. TaxID=1902408 RepID=UPI003C9BF241